MANCKTCKYSSVLLRQCRKNPPHAHVVGFDEQKNQPLVVSIFPSIKPDEDWCGEYVDGLAEAQS